MADWDDLRVFLSVYRNGSVRAAAEQLQVNHATVSRRIRALESRLNVRLFEKLPSGYVATPAAEEILDQAEIMETGAKTIERRVFARDDALNGPLRLTLPPVLATDLLMPDLAAFSRQHPGIELEIITSYDSLNITRREADVALRLVYPDQSPPAHLYGQRLAMVNASAYGAAEGPIPNRWICKEGEPTPQYWRSAAGGSGRALSDIVVSDIYQMQQAALRGMGRALLPCFAGDTLYGVQRIVPGKTSYLGNLWTLTHEDLRQTARVRAFLDFIVAALRPHRAVLAGNRAQD